MEFDAFEAFNLGILVLFIGKFLNSEVPFFRDYNIPEPVTGGLLCSILFTILYYFFSLEINFDLEVRDALILYFFTGIGLNSKLPTLITGGRPLFILLAATILFMVLQDFLGFSLAKITGIPPLIGILGGSASLIGGHGTTIAWAPIFAKEHGISNAMEVGIACATAGLILASLMGGPIARYLICKHNLEPSTKEQPDIGMTYEQGHTKIDYFSVLYCWLILNAAIGLGLGVNEWLEEMGIKLPDFVTCLLVGITLTNTIPFLFKKIEWPSGGPSMSLISELSLGGFLAMSLMNLQLWTLIDLAGPILLILFSQFILALVYNLWIIFPLMGRDYEAAVICAGFGGISLGSTPTAIANMTAVTQKFGAAHKAFLIVPLVCAFFIDIANAFIIGFFVS